MKYFWVRHKGTGIVTIAHYVGDGRWRRFGESFMDYGLLAYEVLKEIEHLVVEERPDHEHACRAVLLELIIMSKQLNVGGTSTISLEFKDKDGADVALPAGSVPAWVIDQVALADIAVATDGLSAEFTAKGVGKVTITVTAEGDPVAGVDTITGTGEVDIVDEASSVTLNFS